MKSRVCRCVVLSVIVVPQLGVVRADEPLAGAGPPDGVEVVRALPVGEVVTIQRDGRRVTTLRRDRPQAAQRRAAAAGGNSALKNGDFSDGLTDWTWSISPTGTDGLVSVVNPNLEAMIEERDSYLVTLQQTFVVPPPIPGPLLELSFDVVQANFDTSVIFIPDAFEVSLLNANNQPLVDPWDPLATSFFNMQEDGTVNTGSTTTWDLGTGIVTIDLTGVPPGTVATLYFDFIGADDDTGGSVTIDDVVLTCQGGDCNRVHLIAIGTPVLTTEENPQVPLLACRIYAELFDPEDELLGVDSANITESDPVDGFWHHPLNIINTAPHESLFENWPDVRHDSFVTIGLDSVPDGVLDRTTLLDFDSGGFNDPVQGYVQGGWYNSVAGNGQGAPDENLRVLIAQLTVDIDNGVAGSVTLFLNDVDNNPSKHSSLQFDCDCTSCTGDLTCDGEVSAVDLAQLLGSWGLCPRKDDCPADLDGDDDVDATDLAFLLGGWGACP